MKRIVIIIIVIICILTACSNVEEDKQYIELKNEYYKLKEDYELLRKELKVQEDNNDSLSKINNDLKDKIVYFEEISSMQSNIGVSNDGLETELDDFISFYPLEQSNHIFCGYVEELTELKIYPSNDAQTINQVMGYVHVIDNVISGGNEWSLIQLNSPGISNHYGYLIRSKIIEREYDNTKTSTEIGIEGIYLGDIIEKVNYMWGRPVLYCNPEMVTYYEYSYDNGISITVEPNELKVRDIGFSNEGVKTSNGLYVGQDLNLAKDILEDSYEVFGEWENRILYEIENGIVISLRYENRIITSIWIHNFYDYDA